MAKNNQWSPVLLDVDGTIVASGELVMECFQTALRDLGAPEVPEDQIYKVVGPPLAVSFNLIGGIPLEEVDQAVDTYRGYYLPRMLEPELYPGIADLIVDLHAAGIPLATATTKMEKSAVEQLERWDLAKYFTVIAGATPDPRCTKVTVVADSLSRLKAAGADLSNPVLVGDRMYDVEGAELNGIKVIGANWGYGDPTEFSSPAVAAVADSVAELRPMLLG